jgi:hypothetical protein
MVVRLPEWLRCIVLLHKANITFEIHPISYPKGAGNFLFSGGKSGREIRLISDIHITKTWTFTKFDPQ